MGALDQLGLAVVLGAAVGVALVALLAAHGGRRALRGTAVVAIGALLAARRLREPPRLAHAGWPPAAAPAPGAPPVLFVVIDTLRADAPDLDPAGRTPNLARLARSADVFTGAIANASWTLPGHASLFTGLILAHHRTDQTPAPGFSSRLPPRIATVHEIFARQGYRTTCVTANGIIGTGTGLARGCQRYANPSRDWLNALLPWRLLSETLASAGRIQSAVSRRGRRLLECRGRGGRRSVRPSSRTRSVAATSVTTRPGSRRCGSR